MEALEHSLFVVDLFNRAVGRPLAGLLLRLGIEVKDPAHFFPDYMVMSLLLLGGLTLTLGLSARGLKLVPGRRQNILEMIVQAFEGLLTDIIGPEGKKYLPVIGSLGLFILFGNLLGLVPGMMSPTSKLNVTLGCALCVFVYYHWQGMKAQGVFKYLKHFMGPIPLLAPLLIPIEVISHFSRPISLSIRLFGNIFAEELLIVIIASIIPVLLPLPFMAVAIFTGSIQAFVFVLLACIYIAGAVAHEEDH
ncbi:MAG: F0F1 ATP synthase subunit A [Candidatus Aminicenantes bacterium]|nr:F0F1 ATP synthase subunit A [Candidatus Aminicenantes bacterium]